MPATPPMVPVAPESPPVATSILALKLSKSFVVSNPVNAILMVLISIILSATISASKAMPVVNVVAKLVILTIPMPLVCMPIVVGSKSSALLLVVTLASITNVVAVLSNLISAPVLPAVVLVPLRTIM